MTTVTATTAASLPVRAGRRRIALGYAAALAAVLITGAYPALTRLSITTSALTPADLLLFRFGVSGLVFMPFLVIRARRIAKAQWLAAIPLSFLQGWGMAACVIYGLRFAPASHAAALGPGAIAAWIAAIGFATYRIRVPLPRLVGISIIGGGVVLMLLASYRGMSVSTALIGDGMFLLASALGATYFVYIQRHRFDPVVAAALVCVASAIVVVPWHCVFATGTIATTPAREVAWQLLLQGLVLGCCALLGLNYATRTLGSQRAGVLSSLVPAIGAVCSIATMDDAVSPLDWGSIVLISAGVAVASMPTRIGMFFLRCLT
ncbi:MAG TPA: DMT family transporter [Casimicrobiaceae bacterium]|nr:DMT family transporter [Casimicrobiaceae bacterium]